MTGLPQPPVATMDMTGEALQRYLCQIVEQVNFQIIPEFEKRIADLEAKLNAVSKEER